MAEVFVVGVLIERLSTLHNGGVGAADEEVKTAKVEQSGAGMATTAGTTKVETGGMAAVGMPTEMASGRGAMVNAGCHLPPYTSLDYPLTSMRQSRYASDIVDCRLLVLTSPSPTDKHAHTRCVSDNLMSVIS